jgi:hypothetical protein
MANDYDIEINNKLIAIENILSSAAALNGGFDKLMLEIDHIKSSQEETNVMVTKVAATIYDPEAGLITKTRDAVTKLADLDKFYEMLDPMIDRHKEMSLWIDVKEKELEKWNDKKADFLIEIDRLSQWKNTVTKILWIMGGSTLGLLAKNLLTVLVQ